jgi:hypothetical protein
MFHWSIAALASAWEGLLVTESTMQTSAAWRRYLVVDLAETAVMMAAKVKILVL